MKKTISILLSAIIITMMSIMPIYAQDNNTRENLFEEAFVQRYVKEGENYRCIEIYYHYDDNNEIDWCLFEVRGEIIPQASEILKFDDFILVTPHMGGPFELCYAVYDVEKNIFLDMVTDYDELLSYDGYLEFLSGYSRCFHVGDSDRDGEITILDVTDIQRGVAEIGFMFPYGLLKDVRGEVYCLQDFDRDEQITILDATAIQRKLAQYDL